MICFFLFLFLFFEILQPKFVSMVGSWRLLHEYGRYCMIPYHISPVKRPIYGMTVGFKSLIPNLPY